MVHVWITPHPCGVFAALEGVGAGQAAGAATDSASTTCCNAATPRHDTPTTACCRTRRRAVRPDAADRPRSASPVSRPSSRLRPRTSSPINVVRLPQWADYKRRRGRRLPQHRRRRHRLRALHQVGLDQRRRHPRSRPPGEPRLRSRSPTARRSSSARCTCCPTTCALNDVPDIGGALMQWHIHDNLCFTADPVAPQVARRHRRQRHVPGAARQVPQRRR